MRIIRKKLVAIAYSILLVFLFQIIFPSAAWALTGGPSQPEVQTFEPIGTTDMVDMFSGDFKYNIPLLDVDGYPVNISYSGGISPDAEASWVGLGWNLNAGAVNRSMRGLPDEFNGEKITKEINMKTNWTVGSSVTRTWEIFGKDKSTGKKKDSAFLNMSAKFGLSFNSYTGTGIDLNLNVSPSEKVMKKIAPNMDASLDIGYSGESGLSISPEISFSKRIEKTANKTSGHGIGLNASASFNSRTGMKTLNFGWGYSNFKKQEGKKDKQIGTLGGSGSLIEYGSPTWTPTIQTPMNTFSMNFLLKVGKEFKGATRNYSLPFYYTQQSVRENVIDKKAYGYMNLENAGADDMMDLNREKDMPFSENNTNLPVPVHTPDIYSVSAQGIGGSFRLYRNDHINYREESSTNNSNAVSAGFDIALGDKIKVGANFSFTNSQTETGNWVQGNELNNSIRLVGPWELPAHPAYEQAYFRQMGEPVVSNVEKNPGLVKYDLLSPIVEYSRTSKNYKVSPGRYNVLSQKSVHNVSTYAPDNVQKERQPRNVLMWPVLARDGFNYASTRDIRWFYRNDIFVFQGQLYPRQGAPRAGNHRAPAHVTELNVLSTDGTRYIFGLPVYNLTQTEVTFSVADPGDCSTGLVSYDPNDLDPKKNKNGQEHYVQKIITPAHAYAHLLTAIVSSDYVDLTGNGPSNDDLGTATKFNYQKPVEKYKWRVPVEQNMANFVEGKKTDSQDDKGSIIYGEKEIFYLHSVEGKNHVALFFISPRRDALGVDDINGALNYNNEQYKLDSILLFNKQDFARNGLNAYKIKGVYFEYDYNLCGTVPNFNTTGPAHAVKGKLTLKKIYFTYGNSFKGKLSPYKFNYKNEGDTDYSYHIKSQDRWGTFKPAGYAPCDNLTDLNSVEFPFTSQDKSLSDEYAGAWALEEIILPSGGKIVAEYEADDYAYVQDRRAMSMYKIEGFALSNDYNTRSDLLYTLKNDQVNTYMFIGLNGTTTQSQLDNIVQGINEMQFTVLADINGQGKYEYVKGYADIEPGVYGLCNANNSAYIRLQWVPIRDKDRGQHVHPISKVLWNWARMNTPELVFNHKVSKNDGFNKSTKFLYELVGLYNELVGLTIGVYNNMRLRGFGQKAVAAKSWVRLNAKDYRKIGGGHRVKSIRINDNWAYMGSMNTVSQDSEYGQEYDYTTDEITPDGISRTISSGVAAYEPGIGSDENPFHMPSYVHEELKWVPDPVYMNDEPYCESFMPPASVGYSKITVRNLSHEGVKRTATGSQEYHFYTAKDFPSIISSDQVTIKVLKPNFVQQLFNFDRKSETTVTAGQGYLIELNDMHGKPKAEYTYSETSKEAIAGVVYDYKTNPANPKELLNTVNIVGKNGSITSREIATEVEVYNDFRQSSNRVVATALNLNADIFTIGLVPMIIPSLFPHFSMASTKVHTAVTVKVVNRYGVLSRTTAIKEGSRIHTDNMLYDELTGNVLVSSVQNEFDDNIYNVSTPAHWAYDQGMGPAYKNINLTLHNVKLHSDSILLPNGLNVRDYLVPGDEVIVSSTRAPVICHVYEGAGAKLNLIEHRNGYVYYSVAQPDRLHTLKVIRSGRKNMHNVPIQQVSSRYLSTAGNNLSIDSVLSVSAVEYKDFWPFYCDKIVTVQCDTSYVLGEALVTDYFNQLNNYKSFKSRGNNMVDSCFNAFLHEKGYTFNDTLYKKISGIYYDIEESTCMSCFDSIYIKSGSSYIGFDKTKWKGCSADLNYLACGWGGDNTVPSWFPYHTLYDNFRHQLDSTGSCDIDSGLKVVLYNNATLNNTEPDIRLNFSKCSNECDLNVYFEDNYCFDSVVTFLNTSFIDDNTMVMNVVTRMPGGSLDTTEWTLSSGCLMKFRTVDCYQVCTTPETADVINPYATGILGNWRAFRNYAYVGERTYSSQVKTRTDGTFKTFEPFWSYHSGSNSLLKSTSVNWVWASEITKYTPHGNEVENRDALGRYSAAIFGYNYTLPIAVGGNTKYEQMAYDGFEENTLFWDKANCFADHFKILGFDTIQGRITTEHKHSGKYSLRVNEAESISVAVDRTTCGTTSMLDSTQVEWNNSNCVGIFNPDTGRYVLSAWLKEGNSFTDTTYANARIQVKLHKTGGSVTTLTFYASGPIIESWQRIFAEFHIDSTVEVVEIVLVGANDHDAWFDDFRIHPFNSNMKSYAYDQVTLRLLAEMDENNFATFYEYDKEGALIRVKKETVKGVQTLKEVRKQIIKNP